MQLFLSVIKGQVISGGFGRVIVRKKSDADIELGELLVSDSQDKKIIMQVTDLIYGSQLSQQNLELVSGLKLEEDSSLELFDSELRNYTLAVLKPVLFIDSTGAKLCKNLPGFLSDVRELAADDLAFLTKPKNALCIGKLRSGSKTINVDISLEGDRALSHHVLIAGTTGRGKSVLMSNLLWNALGSFGILVLDPHDEYFGRHKLGLKDSLQKDRVIYYTSNNPPVGALTLKINLKALKPQHFDGVMDFTDAQKQALNVYYKKYNDKWIEAALREELANENNIYSKQFKEDTIAVVKRKLNYLLDIDTLPELRCSGIFDANSGLTTIDDICNHLEQAKTVIIDTSNLPGPVELLIGSLVATELFQRCKHYKIAGQLAAKPVMSIVLEEAPRVLSQEALERGSNIFETIAREGRKFRIGLIAITQLPSLIPRQILANMNTKIILGIEMKAERQAVIDTAAQDISQDERSIASLDIGEALVTSNFTRFAIPIKIPFFDDIVKKGKEKVCEKDFSGIKIV